ncbi:MAG: hypothetical protein ABJL64_20075 [Rhizobiaceae bacterium]
MTARIFTKYLILAMYRHVATVVAPGLLISYEISSREIGEKG